VLIGPQRRPRASGPRTQLTRNPRFAGTPSMRPRKFEPPRTMRSTRPQPWRPPSAEGPIPLTRAVSVAAAHSFAQIGAANWAPRKRGTAARCDRDGRKGPAAKTSVRATKPVCPEPGGAPSSWRRSSGPSSSRTVGKCGTRATSEPGLPEKIKTGEACTSRRIHRDLLLTCGVPPCR